jgi:predicted PurR-regulated permease PerM
MTEPSASSPVWLTRALLGCLLGTLVLLCAVILRPFVIALVWAAILAYVTWPLLLRMRGLCRQRHTLAAAGLTLLVALGLIGPFSWLAFLLQDQLADAYQAAIAYCASPEHALPAFVKRIPWVGEAIERALQRYSADPALLRQFLIDWAQRSHAELLGLVGDVGRNLGKLLTTLVTLFFLYRDADRLLQQARGISHYFFGERLSPYLQAAGAMTRAVVYGLLATAIAQGTLAGVGYWAAGVEAPALLAAVTALVALIPFGAPVVWGSIGIWLLFDGHVGAGIGLLLWGALVVSWVDNLVRPLVISGATRAPFLLVLFGVLGGLTAFGLVGLFVGPVVLAVALAVWRQWIDKHAADRPLAS